MIIGTGVDIIEISRVQAAIERNGERFLTRVFTAGEHAYCQARQLSAMHYAGRFAAKEAAFKALGTGWRKGLRLLDVQVSNDPLGAPSLTLIGGALERSRALGVTGIHVSLSHQAEYAIAQVILEGEAGRRGE